MITPRALLQKIVILGDGQTGLMAAIALARSLPFAQIDIVTGDNGFSGFADLACTALPFTNRLHDRFGLDEAMMVREAGATHRIAVKYTDWGGPGTVGSATYGAALPIHLRSAFARHWGGTARRGDGGIGALSLGEALAKEGRFAPPPPDADGPLSELDYGLRWDRKAYMQLLVARAAAAHVRHHKAPMAQTIFNDAGIDTVTLSDGTTLNADLWLDCSGEAARLISQVDGYARCDWSARLAVSRVAVVRGNRGQLSLDDRIGLTKAGWVAQTMGPDGQEAVLGLATGLDDVDARRLFGTDALHFFDVKPGRVDKPWLGNVIALGDAAMQIEPLAWTNLDFAHRMIDLLLEMLPGREIHPLERDEFNRRFVLMAEANCDFVASHYAAPASAAFFGTPQMSEQLALCLEQYQRRGKLPFIEEAAMAGREWHGVLRALGIAAGGDVVSRAEDEASHRAALAEHQAMLAAVVRELPPYDAWYRGVMQG